MKGTGGATDVKRVPGSFAIGLHSKDYFVTTMELRKMASAEKPQKRQLFKYAKFAPPCASRTLDNYPMPHNRADAVRSAKGHRTSKQDAGQRMATTTVSSGAQREHSKDMFNFCVRNVNNINLNVNSFNDTSSRQSVTTNKGKENSYKSYSSASAAYHSQPEVDRKPSYSNNGPTPDGSVLHNRRQKVLNDIRIRPHHETESRYNHERTQSSLSLRTAISEKTRAFRVLSTSDSSRQDQSFTTSRLNSSDFIFLPNDGRMDGDNEHNAHDTLNGLRSNVTSTLSTYAEYDSYDVRDPFDDVDSRSLSMGGEFKPIDHSSRPNSLIQPKRGLLPPSTPCRMRIVSLEEATSSESEGEAEDGTPEVKKPEPPPTPAKTGR